MILKQQVIIGFLLIGLSIGALVCHLSVKTLDETKEVVGQTIQLGTATITIYAILYHYGGILFFKLDYV